MTERMTAPRLWRSVAVVGIVLTFAVPALAGNVVAGTPGRYGFSIGDQGVSDWNGVERCASRPYAREPEPAPNVGSYERLLLALDKTTEIYFAQTEACRYMLIARHAGWVAAGGKPKADPFKPVPLFNRDDFKYPLK